MIRTILDPSAFNPIDLHFSAFTRDLHKLLSSVRDAASYCASRTQGIFREVWKLDQPGPVPRGVATSKVTLCMERIEHEMASLHARRSWYYWLYLTARIPPFVKPESKLGTARQAHDALRASCLKYGNRSVEADMDHIPARASSALDGVFRPSEVTQRDVEDALCLANLAHTHALLGGKLRTIWKGGKAEISSASEFFAPEPAGELKKAIQLYERRRFKPLQGRCFHGTSGIWVEREEWEELAKGALKGREPVMWSAERNFEGLEMGFFWPDEEQIAQLLRLPTLYVPNYRIQPIPGRRYLAVLESYWTDEIENDLGFTPRELICFLCAVALKQAAAIMRTPSAIGSRQQLMQTGYFVLNIGDLHMFYQDAYQAYFQERPSGPSAVDTVQRLVQKLTYSDNETRRVDLWDGIPVLQYPHPELAKPIINIPGYGISFDSSSVCVLLESVLSAIGRRRGSSGEQKGRTFEDYVRRHIKDRFKNAQAWPGRWRFAGPEGIETDIDVCFEIGPVFWCVECKAKIVTRAWERGEPDEIKKRERVWREAVSKHRARCMYVAENPSQFAELPKQIQYIFSVCCSPFAEYFADLGPDIMLTDAVPVVCTPEELVQFLEEWGGPDNYKGQHMFRVRWPKTTM